MKIQNENWECVAPSGVAAVQINGKTLHGLIRMDGKCSSFISPESSQARELKTVHGIIDYGILWVLMNAFLFCHKGRIYEPFITNKNKFICTHEMI